MSVTGLLLGFLRLSKNHSSVAISPCDPRALLHIGHPTEIKIQFFDLMSMFCLCQMDTGPHLLSTSQIFQLLLTIPTGITCLLAKVYHGVYNSQHPSPGCRLWQRAGGRGASQWACPCGTWGRTPPPWAGHVTWTACLTQTHRDRQTHQCYYIPHGQVSVLQLLK